MTFNIRIKAVGMPAVGKGFQRRWHGRLEVPSLQQAPHPPRVLLAGPPLQSLGKKEGGKSSQEWKRRWRDRGDRGKVRRLDRFSSQGRDLDCPAALLTLPSLSLLPCHLTLLPWESTRWEGSLRTPRPVGDSGAP